MGTNDRSEARLRSNNVLLALPGAERHGLPASFFGEVRALDALRTTKPGLAGKTVYLCGDLELALGLDLTDAARVFAVADAPVPEGRGWAAIGPGRVPVDVHGVGVYYRRFFDPDEPYFERVCAEHAFQSLTESNKPGTAHRTGIYLTRVERAGAALRFRLLRCSTNLAGPTENLRATDAHIVDAVEREAAFVFDAHAPLNHVLAQVYRNTAATAEHKQSKAKISSHADKTKDMPRDGVMAFCTFYDRLDGLKPSKSDAYDYVHRDVSGLTRLRFRRKEGVTETLPAEFTLTLYPGSVFFMPLSTNRLYTHEIVSAALDAAMLPTRLGYVVRCSNAEAVHEGGQTFLARGGELVALEEPTPEGMAELRRLYAEENRAHGFVEYGDLRFSMNKGDYLAPAYDPADEFRVYSLGDAGAVFEALAASATFEALGKGRAGAVLVRPDEAGRVPIVRTTTRYGAWAQRFGAAHERLATEIARRASLAEGFNNALIERYTNAYASMGAHSDQALDLAEGSHIALFSCYAHPERERAMRTLVVEEKGHGGGRFEVPLAHNSVVVFSLETNRRFRHKIVLAGAANAPENDWLGVTFRTSKTLVAHREGRAWLADDAPLALADEGQAREFYALRGRENSEAGFVYPRVAYTLSPSDLVPAVEALARSE